MSASSSVPSAKAFNRLQKIVPFETRNSSNMSVWSNVPEMPPDAIFFVQQRYREDSNPNKVNLGIGAYRDDNGKPYVLNVVKKVEADMLNDASLNKEYLPIHGDAEFVQLSQGLILGSDCRALNEGRVCGVQTLSGTGALRVLGDFLYGNFPNSKVYVSNPTWGNHNKVFMKSGFEMPRKYAYWNQETRALNYDGMINDLRNAPPSSIILLHACAHNPTGVDPTLDQWNGIADVIQEKGHITFFDCAYQGYATGDLDGDAAAVRLFERRGMEFIVAQSYAKNMGLYGERAGCASVVCNSVDGKKACFTQLKSIIRPMYSNPPKHGATIAKRIMGNRDDFRAWVDELQGMSGRILEMRASLRRSLEVKNTPGTWQHITDQIGMFTFTGLSPQQAERMEKQHHVYMLSNGRISMAGISSKNVEYVATAMDDCVRNA